MAEEIGWPTQRPHAMPDLPPFPRRHRRMPLAEVVRDEEARVAALSPWPVFAPGRAALTPVVLDVYPGRLWLPECEAAEPAGVPDDTWQGWHWPRDESLLLNVLRLPAYWRPDLGIPITVLRPDLRRVTVVGRPMRVRVLGPGDAGWAGDGYMAVVEGFLDARTLFWAQAVGATPERRAMLLAAVCTLELDTS